MKFLIFLILFFTNVCKAQEKIFLMDTSINIYLSINQPLKNTKNFISKNAKWAIKNLINQQTFLFKTPTNNYFLQAYNNEGSVCCQYFMVSNYNPNSNDKVYKLNAKNLVTNTNIFIGVDTNYVMQNNFNYQLYKKNRGDTTLLFFTKNKIEKISEYGNFNTLEYIREYKFINNYLVAFGFGYATYFHFYNFINKY